MLLLKAAVDGLQAATNLLGRINAAVLALGRGIGVACVASMVVIILVQVWWRYVLGNALPWTEEAARFLMLWMTGLMAPTAFRRGGFVAIDMVLGYLPRRLGALINLASLSIAFIVIWVGFHLGWAETMGIGGRFTMSALQVPTSWDFSVWMKVPRAWMMASLSVGVTLMLSVVIELIARTVLQLLGQGQGLIVIAQPEGFGAE
jgi:TRAP-type transport system small permease protein